MIWRAQNFWGRWPKEASNAGESTQIRICSIVRITFVALPNLNPTPNLVMTILVHLTFHNTSKNHLFYIKMLHNSILHLAFWYDFKTHFFLLPFWYLISDAMQFSFNLSSTITKIISFHNQVVICTRLNDGLLGTKLFCCFLLALKLNWDLFSLHVSH